MITIITGDTRSLDNGSSALRRSREIIHLVIWSVPHLQKEVQGNMFLCYLNLYSQALLRDPSRFPGPFDFCQVVGSCGCMQL